MSSSEESVELEAEMTNLTVELLSLSQDLITAKLRLEAAAKTGWILLAKARYVRGGGGLDISQVPSTEGDRQMVAGVRVNTKECLQVGKRSPSVRVVCYYCLITAGQQSEIFPPQPPRARPVSLSASRG